MDFASLLAAQRRARRLSQARLSSLSGVAQRHISFLETRRSRPGRKTVEKLALALSLDFEETNALYSSAGLAPPRSELDWNSPEFSDARNIIQRMLIRHNPYPSLAMSVSGEILLANEGFHCLLARMYAGKPAFEGSNLFDLTFHPDGLTQFMLNPERILPHTLRRLDHAAQTSQAAQIVLQRVQTYPSAKGVKGSLSAVPLAAGSVVVERFVVNAEEIAITSLTASFGSPENVTAQHIRILLFFPADTQSEKFFAQLAE